MIIQSTKGSNSKLTTWANMNEFDCKCRNRQCKSTYINVRVAEAHSRLCDIVGGKVEILSSYKCTIEQHDSGEPPPSLSHHGSSITLRRIDSKCPKDFKVAADSLFDSSEYMDSKKTILYCTVRIY